MQRAEQAGFGVAVAGHVLLFGALSLVLNVAPKPVLPVVQSVDIQIVDNVGPTDTAPNPSTIAPAASVAPFVGAPVVAALSNPVATPTSHAAPAAPAAPAAKPPMPTPGVTKPTSKLARKTAPAAPPRPKLSLDLSRPDAVAPRGSRLGNDFLKGVTDRASTTTGQTSRAAAGPSVAASLAREVLRQLKPHWKAPTGADVEQLRTLLSIHLNPDGTVAAVKVIDTTGVTESNRAQVRLHQEAAVKAVRLAAPFVLPTELYDAWKVLEPVTFDKRLG